MSSFIFACKDAPITPDPYQNLTVDAVQGFCDLPSGVFPVPVAGMFMLVATHDKCLGHENILIVTWPGESSEIERTAAKLLSLLYARFKQDAESLTCQSALLKHDTSTDNNMSMAFYSMECASTNTTNPTNGDNDDD